MSMDEDSELNDLLEEIYAGWGWTSRINKVEPNRVAALICIEILRAIKDELSHAEAVMLDFAKLRIEDKAPNPTELSGLLFQSANALIAESYAERDGSLLWLLGASLDFSEQLTDPIMDEITGHVITIGVPRDVVVDIFETYFNENYDKKQALSVHEWCPLISAE